ncbi:MAG: hypothetical protein ACREYE_22380, partial [Gammaproteobacteria bacterium]
LGISRSGGARNPHVFQYTLRFLRSGGTRPSFARDGFFTNSQRRCESTRWARVFPKRWAMTYPLAFSERSQAERWARLRCLCS